MSAPVLDVNEKPLAAVSVTCPATRFRPESHANAVRAAAAGIATTIARRQLMTGP